MYFIRLYNKSFTPITTLLQTDVVDFQYVTELNKIGSASFKIPVKHPKSTTTNLSVFNRVIIENETGGKFIGFIEEISADINMLEVRCLGILGLLKKRLTSANISGQDAATAFFSLLSATNGSDDTGIIQGVSNFSYTINSLPFSRSSIFDAMVKIAEMAGNKEFTVDPLTRILDFKTAIGLDLSAVVTLFFDVNQLERSSVYDFQVTVSGKEVANSVTGVGNALTSTKTSAPDIASVGLLETAQSFSQTANSGNLDDETQNYLNAHKTVLYTPSVKINTKKIDASIINVGDIVDVYLNNGFISLNLTHRIVKKQVTITDTGEEDLAVDLIDSTRNILPQLPLIGDISSLLKRVSLLEGKF